MDKMGLGEDDDLLALAKQGNARIDKGEVEFAFAYRYGPAHLQEERKHGVTVVDEVAYDGAEAMEIDHEEIANIIPERLVVRDVEYPAFVVARFLRLIFVIRLAAKEDPFHWNGRYFSDEMGEIVDEHNLLIY